MDATQRGWAEEDRADRRQAFESAFDGWTAPTSDDDYGGFAARKKRWAFLLDRDGVLNRDVGSPGVVDVADFELLPGVADAVAAVKARGHAVAVVTNQSARRKGLLSARTLDAVHGALRRAVDVDVVLAAAGLDDGSPAPKPSPALEAALDRFGIRADDAVLVGDARTDLGAASAANLRRGARGVVAPRRRCEAELADRSFGHAALAAADGPAGRRPRRRSRCAAVFPDLPPRSPACSPSSTTS
ncbi:HAD-hyrolase-like protein [Aureococcus anophagefferens]|nr:HAD-hyrolase-like protein [Aureococcus anophagefferens]